MSLSRRYLYRNVRSLVKQKYIPKFYSSESDGCPPTLTRKIINTYKAPVPTTPYNQGVVIGSTLYISGCLGIDKDTMKLAEGGVKSETTQALKNLGHVLEAAGSSYDKVIKATVFMIDLDDFAAINEVYKEFFTKDYPARSSFQIGKLPLCARVEIEAIAAVGNVKTVVCR